MENEAELIRQQMLETRTSLSEKLEALQEQVLSTVEDTTKTVTDTVQTVQEAVQDTVSTVSDSVQDTVDTVKETFDLSRQMQNHPWLMVGGAVAIGYVGGRLLERGLPRIPLTRMNGYATAATSGPAPHPTNQPSWFSNLLGPMFKQVQELAIGAIAGVASDLAMQHAPENLRGKLNEMTENIASSLGATPIHGLLSEETFNGKHS